VGVGDAQQHAVEAAHDKALQEVTPEALGLGLADVQAEYLAAARLVHAVGDHERLLADTTRLADALDLRVEPEVGVAAFERTRAKRGDLPIKTGAQP
jgi:hypothetical protein